MLRHNLQAKHNRKQVSTFTQSTGMTIWNCETFKWAYLFVSSCLYVEHFFVEWVHIFHNTFFDSLTIPVIEKWNLATDGSNLDIACLYTGALFLVKQKTKKDPQEYASF